MAPSELRLLVVDGPTEPVCPYCDCPGGTVKYSGHHLHQQCYDDFGRELDILYGERHVPLNQQIPGLDRALVAARGGPSFLFDDSFGRMPY